ncbi:MAG: FAD-dependent oxidoreductase, partial [Woeseia sp.]
MTSRRALLQSLAALPLVGACAGPRFSGQQNYTPSGLPLRRVLVSPDRVVRVVTGLRPYRPSGFVVRPDKLDDKTIIHNYGHGGGGITLSWGTSHMALELAMQSEHRRCAVLGCGAVGLASARLLQRHGWDVTIYAKDLPPNTTSNIAGAQWSPASLYDDGFSDPQFFNDLDIAMRHSYREFQHLVGPNYGVSWVSNYVLSDRPQADGDIHVRYPDMFPERRALPTSRHPFPAEHALHFDTMFIEPPRYLPAIMNDYHAAGGKIVIRDFQDRQELLTLGEPVIIN